MPVGLVEHPENMDPVNWIINQEYVGQNVVDAFPETLCTGTINFGDVPQAIWALVEDDHSATGLGWSQCRVDEIVAAALTNGEGFVPICNDYTAVILVPVQGPTPLQIIIAQVTLIEVGVPCDTIDETAWGEGEDFPGKNWAMYFTYTLQSPVSDQ